MEGVGQIHGSGESVERTAIPIGSQEEKERRISGECMDVCEFVFIELHKTTQPGAIIVIFQCYVYG